MNARHQQQAQKIALALPGMETNDHNSGTKDPFSISLYQDCSLIFKSLPLCLARLCFAVDGLKGHSEGQLMVFWFVCLFFKYIQI